MNRQESERMVGQEGTYAENFRFPLFTCARKEFYEVLGRKIVPHNEIWPDIQIILDYQSKKCKKSKMHEKEENEVPVEKVSTS